MLKHSGGENVNSMRLKTLSTINIFQNFDINEIII